MTAIRAKPQDPDILTLFRQWVEAMQRYNAFGPVITELIESQQDRALIEQTDATVFHDEADAIERQIYDMPTSDAAGLAIKAYFCARR